MRYKYIDEIESKYAAVSKEYRARFESASSPIPAHVVSDEANIPTPAFTA